MNYVLNLSKGFDPYKNTTHVTIPLEKFIFNGGEPHLKTKGHSFETGTVIVTSRASTSDEVIFMLLAVDALRRLGAKDIELFISYFPGARQDRVMEEGEPLSVKVYADLINNLNLNKVTIYDPHSDVAPALLNNCKVITNEALVRKVYDTLHKQFPDERYVLISPDAGAAKKTDKLGKALGLDVIHCTKHRDTATGEITGFSIEDDSYKDKVCLVVDDICDGGRTFIGIGELLKEASDVTLIVSHGIFSRGFVKLGRYFTEIHTTNSWVNNYAMDIPEIERGSEIVTIHKIEL